VTRNYLNSSKKRKAAADEDFEDDEFSSDGSIEENRRRRKSKKIQSLNIKPRSPPANFQLLDLNTPEPCVSYYEHIYSCSWVDMVGTNMFLGQAQQNPTQQVHLTPEYHVIGTSRIKLVGERTHMPKLVSQKRTLDDEEVAHSTRFADAFPGSKRRQTEVRQQADFLQKLIDAKHRRGEQDVVTVVPGVRVPLHNEAANAIQQRQEIETLNKQALDGDAGALCQLSRVRDTANQPLQAPS
jgi:hypothetical protein